VKQTNTISISTPKVSLRGYATADRGPPGDEGKVLAVHTVHQIGPKRSLLPNGNMLCHDVPIARSGWLLYGPGEVPVKAGSNGIVYIERTNDQLFNEKTVASFNAAAVTNDHPYEDVTPVNWNGLAGGFALNVRRGTGDDADVLLADLMLTNTALIDAVNKGKVEVSAGYDADYEDLGGGMGRQSNIIGNHIALVDKVRCGPRCAIGDQAYFVPPTLSKEKPPMSTTRTPLRTQRVALADDDTKEAARQKVRDAQAELEALETGGDASQGNHIHIHMAGTATNDAGGGDGQGAAKTLDAAVEARFTKLETAIGGIGETLAKLVPGATVDGLPEGLKKKVEKDDDDDEDEKPRKKKTDDGETRDSAALETSYTDLAASAEILVPGFKTPTFDAKATRAVTVDRMCNVRRKVLDQFGTTDEGKAILLAANGGVPVDLLTMDCAGAAQLFKNASTAKASINNMSATRDSKTIPTSATVVSISSLPSAAEMNAAAAKFWEGK